MTCTVWPGIWIQLRSASHIYRGLGIVERHERREARNEKRSRLFERLESIRRGTR